MKRILLSALGLISFAMSFAQSPVVYQDENVQVIDSVQVSFEQIVDSVFANVDLSQVPSGILIDKTLSTLDYSNFVGQPTLPATENLGQWRHLYNVFFRNANNEAQKWQTDLQDSLAAMNNLLLLRDLPGEKETDARPCGILVDNPSRWKAQYERLRTNVLTAAQQYPPTLPRIRKWLTHVDEVLLDIYAVEADTNFTVLNDSNRVDFLSWSQLYRFINQAAINQQPLPALEEVIPAYQRGQPIPIVLLDMNYHRIRPDAVAQNLLRFSGIQLSDVAGRSESPYEALSLLAAAPVVPTLESTSPSFIIRPEHIFGNRAEAINSITVDFGDGQGFREVRLNDPFNVQYADAGEKRMIFKVTYEDCSFAISHTAVLVDNNDVAINGRTMGTQDFEGVADEEFSIRANRPYEGGFASGQVTIEYGCGNDRLMKPLIIVEGFSPEQFEVLEESETYDDFVDKIPFNLRNDLQNSGYDLVYLDYNDGGTYIQRNAYLLQALIQRVNAMKEANGSTEPNVVMGISMGGLVARYALADMEQLGETHDTRLYISFDSPHQGANVPLGFQYAAYHLPQVRLGGKSLQKIYERNPLLALQGIPAPNTGVQLAENPAARQMLIRHASPFFAADHQAFMDEYQELGYPTQCRNIAIANGSQTGQGQGFEPGSLLFGLKSGSVRSSIYGIEQLWDVLGFNDVPFALGGPAMAITGSILFPVANILVGYKANIKVWALEDYSRDWQTVYRGHISGASYNFGEGSTLSTTDRMSDIIISTGGQLFINANSPIGPSADAGDNPPPTPNSTFEVHVSPYDNCAFQDGEVEVRDYLGCKKAVISFTASACCRCQRL